MGERGFDDIIHAPVRLRICGLLRQADRPDFAVLRDALEVTDATLSKHVKVLAAAGALTNPRVRIHPQGVRPRGFSFCSPEGAGTAWIRVLRVMG